jgi:hypothetical protein
MTEPNPYAAPTAEVRDMHTVVHADIDTLPVSDNWKARFRLFDKAGGPKLPNFKQLPFGERMKISFNILGFLFGPIYYAVKGMWKKGLAMFGALIVGIVVLSFVLELVGMGQLNRALGYAAAALFAVRANVDYYKKMVLGDDGWW